MSTWDPDLQIFLHDPNTFFYSEKAEVNTKLLNTQILKDSAYPRAVGNCDILPPVQNTSINLLTQLR